MIIINEITWLYKKKNTLSLREMYEKCKKRFDNNNNNNKLILIHSKTARSMMDGTVRCLNETAMNRENPHGTQNDPHWRQA